MDETGAAGGTHTLRSGALYFAVVFGAGFVLGPIRILWAVPRFGTRVAELMEMPIMLVVIVVAARWISRDGAAKPSRWLGTGIVALALMLLAEFAVVLPLRGLSIREYAARLDPVSGTVYYLLLGSLAVMPLLVGRGRPRTTPSAIERPSRRGAAEGPSPRWTPGDSP